MSEEQEESKTVTRGLVGEELRAAREAEKLSVSEAAHRQNLRPAIIEAIESGDYEAIDSELFLKGYVRSYAGLLGLDSDKLLTTLDAELEPLRQREQERQRNNPLEQIEQRKKRKQRIARWTAFLVLAGLFAAIAFWVIDRGLLPSDGPATDQSEQEQQQDQTQGGGVADENILDTEEPLAPEESETTTVITESETSAGSEDPVQTDPAGSEPDSLLTGAAETEEAPNDGDVSSDEPGTTEETETGAASEATTESQQQAPTTTNEAPTGNQLVMSFSGDCWVQVEEAGKTVISGLRRSGDEVRYQSDEPLRVVIGAVDVAEVTFNNEKIDLSAVASSNNRAVLRLGSDNP